MPEIDIQRQPQRSVPIWLWIAGAILAALLIWGLIEAFDNDQATAPQQPTERVAGERGEIGAPEALPLATIVGTPNDYFGKDVRGTATVAEVTSDRGFWVENQGQRAFVVLGEGMTERDVNITQGQQVLIEGTYMESANMGQVPQLEQDAQNVIQGETGFIRANSVDILEQRGQQQAQ